MNRKNQQRSNGRNNTIWISIRPLGVPRRSSCVTEVICVFIYPENLKAKPMLWLWLLRDVAVIGIGALLSFFALAQGLGLTPLVLTILYAFVSIQVDGSSILDFLHRAACFLLLRQQFFVWRLEP